MSKKVFNFKRYPELKPYHTKLKKLVNEAYKAEFKYYHTNSEEDNKIWNSALETWSTFENEYSKVIFSTLDKEKPLLLNMSSNNYEKWDDVINSKERIDWCVTIVEQSGGRYRLSPEYYIEK